MRKRAEWRLPGGAPPVAAFALALLMVACSKPADVTGERETTPETEASPETTTAPQPELSELGSALFAPLNNRFTGDLRQMVDRRAIRVVVVPTRTQYWIHDGRPIGIEYERLRAFEQWLNRRHDTDHRHLSLHVVYVPTRRDDLIPALIEGRGDIAVGMLTATDERLQQVEFAGPFLKNVYEIPVTNESHPPLASVDELAGRRIAVRRSASYWSHLQQLSERFVAEGREPIDLHPVSEYLTDDDLLEMVAAGLIEMTVVDRYAARLWKLVFEDLQLHEDAAVNEGGQLGWLVRKESLELKAEIDAFARTHGQGSLFGNSVLQKYTGSTQFVDNALSDDDLVRFRGTYSLFEKYASRYSLDPLLLVAQGYQESRLRQSARSRAGAIGIMQVLPSTGRALEVGDINELEPNIHAGAKYVRRIIDTHFPDPEIDELNRTLFAFAAYNAGPARVKAWRRRASERGLDPDVWLNNVELIAAERIGSETVTYVANIYKYYVAYTLAAHAVEMRREAREQAAA